jgi:DNA ligase-1
MAYRSMGKQATRWVLLLGTAFSPLWVLAAEVAPVGLQAPAELPPALMQANLWEAELDPGAFLISEKLDGVRAFWDGHVLRFRSGRHIVAPNWFIAALPATPLDGELWLGRGSFDQLSGLVRRQVPLDAEWRDVRYMIFDLPAAPGSFAARVARLPVLLASAGVPWLQALAQSLGQDRVSLQRRLLQLDRLGGEGLILHRADALWLPGRSDALRKLKIRSDEEARVLAYLPGKGRHAGRMGALLLEMANGQRFALGTGFTDAQRDVPPPLGAFVTYQYQGRTSTGLPRFASFLRFYDNE